MHPIYPTKVIKQNFNIKLNIPPVYFGTERLCTRVSHSLGISGFYKFVKDKELADKMITKAMKSKKDKIEYKLRRGAIIRFYSR